jgi:predicted Zn-dependent protease
MDKKMYRLFLISAFVLLVCSCSDLDPQYKSIGSSILGSTGYVSGSQVDAAFDAGGKLGKAARGLNDEQEYYLGRSVSALIFTHYKPLHNKKAIDYVNKVGRVVAAASDKPETYNGYKFMILDSNEINALSAPGGYVFVTKGFINILPDEDALAAVLAHEVGHIALGHGMKAISSSNLTDALLIIGKEAAASQTSGYASELTNLFGDSVNQVFDTLITSGYSRSQEYDADKYAAHLLAKSGYNPNSLQTALERLDKAGAAGASGGWASTHPKPSKRLGELEDVLPKLAPSATANAVLQNSRSKRFKEALG